MSSLIGQRLGQYEIISLLGKGGMASVYRARQVSIDRDVAVKVIRPDLAEAVDFIKRFEREAKTVASLSHLHILKVFDYGEQGDIVYLVMELLTGGSLADRLHQGPLTDEMTTHLLDQMASALDYAHQKGIIHRDMKPQNVLLDEANNAFLTDFGLAKILGESTALTQSGTAMGTPAYMPPEQWKGEPLDASADNYALGVIVYEMLSGKLPFNAETPFSMMHMHVSAPPPPIRQRRPDLPAGIENVLNKALAKDRDNRYQSATALATDVKKALSGQQPVTSSGRQTQASPQVVPSPQSNLDDEPTLIGQPTVNPANPPASSTLIKAASMPQASPQSSDAPAAKQGGGRRRLVAILGGLVVVLAAGGILFSEVGLGLTGLHPPVGSPKSVATAKGNGGVASKGTQLAVAASDTPNPLSVPSGSGGPTAAPTRTVFADIAITQAPTRNGEEPTIGAVAVSPAASRVAQYAPPTTVITAENAAKLKSLLTLGNPSSVQSVAFSADGTFLAAGSGDNSVYVVSLKTRAARTFKSHTGRVWEVAFSPDSGTLASGSEDQTVKLWDVQSGKLIRTLTGHTDVIWGLAFSPNGSVVASGSADQTVKLWDIQSGSLIKSIPAGPDANVAFGPGGKIFAATGPENTIQLWDTQGQHLLKTLKGHTGQVYSLAFSLDEKYMASSSADNTVIIWDRLTPEQKPIFTIQAKNPPVIGTLAFSPNGQVLAIGQSDGSILLWDVQANKAITQLTGHTAQVDGVAFDPSGMLLASAGSDDDSVRLWAIP